VGVAAGSEVLPRGHLIFEGRHTDKGPTLTLGAFSQLFFAEPYPWIRFRLDRMREKDGEQWQPRSSASRGAKVRLTLADMEIVVHGLCHHGYISVDDLQYALLTLWWLGHLHGTLERRR